MKQWFARFVLVNVCYTWSASSIRFHPVVEISCSVMQLSSSALGAKWSGVELVA
jgi:hypothetical protein